MESEVLHMDNIRGAGGTQGGILKNIAQTRGPGGQAAIQDSFTKNSPADPDIEKQKILKDMILNKNEDPLHVLWCADVGSGIAETPMSSPDGKTLYAACGDGKIHAIDTSTGKEKWAASSSAGSMWDANATLSHDGNHIFVTGQNGVLECFDAAKGELAWQVSSSGSRRNFSKTVLRCGDRNECTSDGKTVFASLENRQVSAIDVKTGKKKWDMTLKYDAYGKPVLSQDEKKLYMGSGQGATGFIVIDASTGKKKNEFYGGDPAMCSAAIDSSGKKVFVAGLGSFMACKLNKKGDEIWKFAQDSGIFATPPVMNEKDSTVYAMHHDLHRGSTIFALDTGTGKPRWSYEANSEINASPTLSRDGSTLFVGTKDGEFAAIDSATGKKKWGFKITTAASPGVSPDGTVIYIGSQKGKLYALAEDALEECLARKAAAGDGKADDVPTVELGEDFVMIGGIKLAVNAG
jgi:outer membrane protein assembly factor BamB